MSSAHPLEHYFSIHHNKFRNNFHIKFLKVEHESVFFLMQIFSLQ